MKTQTRSTKCTFKVTFFLHVFKMRASRSSKVYMLVDIAPPTLPTSNIENFLSKLSKTMVQETRNGFIEIILDRNYVTENRSDTKKLLQPTGLKNNLGQGIYPVTVSLSFLKRVMSRLGSVILLNLSDQVYFCRYSLL